MLPLRDSSHSVSKSLPNVTESSITQINGCSYQRKNLKHHTTKTTKAISKYCKNLLNVNFFIFEQKDFKIAKRFESKSSKSKLYDSGTPDVLSRFKKIK